MKYGVSTKSVSASSCLENTQLSKGINLLYSINFPSYPSPGLFTTYLVPQQTHKKVLLKHLILTVP